MVVRLGRNYGFQLRRMAGSSGRMYLSAVIWFRRRNGYLGYKYPSIRWF